MAANQLSKGIVRAGTVKASRIEVNGVPIDASVTLADILPTAPVSVTGDRDDPESALKNLLQALENLGLINDTTVSGA